MTSTKPKPPRTTLVALLLLIATFLPLLYGFSSFNTEAKRLYLRLGYEVVGELRDYIVRGHSEILLRKTIGPRNDTRGGGAP